MMLSSLLRSLALLAMPVGLLWLALLGGAWLCWRTRQRWAAALFLVVALAYAVAGNVYFGGALLAGLERRIPPVRLAGLEPFDAVCVLGGGSQQDERGEPELNSEGDRIFLAARLWHAGKARLLVVSGMSRDGLAGFRDGGQETRALLRSVGVPDRAILVVTQPCWNTGDEIRAYARLQGECHWARLGLLSSASHLPRALALAERERLRMEPLGADRLGRDYPFLPQMLVPQEKGFRFTTTACWEHLGRLMGH